MPTLHWIGKEKVINHHLDVPFRVLEHSYGFDNGKQHKEEKGSGNKIIHGDNLEALKALLPEYEGRVKCIYIDPPYNTGNEGWVYNDNVNDPKIKKWLGQVVGKESEDLSRHDKWLCMMYPRLKLLHKLLADDGMIFVSIDEFEHDYLHLLLDEIFARKNRVQTFIWKKTYGGGAKSKHAVNLHEYILFYAKNIDDLPVLDLPPDESILKYYKLKDSKFDERGPYRLQPLATNSMDSRPNLRYAINFKGNEIWPQKQWQWSQKRTNEALENDELVIQKNDKTNSWSVNYKQYLKNEDGKTRGRKMYSIIDNIYTQHGTNELTSIFKEKKFDFPKPPRLLELLLQLVTKENDLILDSFAGSGTTAHAVLNLNKQDGGKRKFILVEMEAYAETVTAERIKRVIKGYGSAGSAQAEGTGGGFDFYQLGQPLFHEDGNLNESVGAARIRKYVWYTETKTSYELGIRSDELTGNSDSSSRKTHHSYLGTHNDTAYYFHYEPEAVTTLNHEFLAGIKAKAEQYVIYADNCLLTKEFMTRHRIIFKKIPRDITRF